MKNASNRRKVILAVDLRIHPLLLLKTGDRKLRIPMPRKLPQIATMAALIQETTLPDVSMKTATITAAPPMKVSGVSV